MSEDLEGLDEKREEAQERSHKYGQRMTEAYGRMTRERMFSATCAKGSGPCATRYDRTI